jgi:hypothetical protein
MILIYSLRGDLELIFSAKDAIPFGKIDVRLVLPRNLDCVTGFGSPKWVMKSGSDIIERKLAEERWIWERSVSNSFFAGCQRPAAIND